MGGRDVNLLLDLFKASAADVFLLMERLKSSDTPTDRRAFVRSGFAFVESMLFALKQEALRHPSEFSSAELAVLREETYELSDTGEVHTRPARLSLQRNLRFTFAAYARAHGTTADLELSASGWQHFQRALKVRDRLMHPKSTADLDVSDTDLASAREAVGWFHFSYALALAGAAGAMHRRLKAADQAGERPTSRAAQQGVAPDEGALARPPRPRR